MTTKRISPKKHEKFPEIEHLQSIPCQVGLKSKISLYELGLQHQGKGAVVELGSYLGGSIAHLCAGLKKAGIEVPVYCYDFFVGHIASMNKVKEAGLDFGIGDSCLDLFYSNVKPIYPSVIGHPTDIMDVTWNNAPVEIFIDDVCKRPPKFHYNFPLFLPSFIPGVTKIALLDFYYYRKYDSGSQNYHSMGYQAFVLEKLSDYFELLEDNSQYDSGAIFHYKKELDLETFHELIPHPEDYDATFSPLESKCA